MVDCYCLCTLALQHRSVCNNVCFLMFIDIILACLYTPAAFQEIYSKFPSGCNIAASESRCTLHLLADLLAHKQAGTTDHPESDDYGRYYTSLLKTVSAIIEEVSSLQRQIP